jgi:amidase
MADIAFSSASYLAGMIRCRKIGCLELLDHFIARVERLDSRLNAVIVRDFERARADARRSDNEPARGPLHGVPTTVKEAFDVGGLQTTWGLPPFRDNVAKHDGLPVARLKAAGAVVFGKTNVPTGLTDWQSQNEIYGTTVNPWDLARSPGGSSGGSAAAVAAGLTGLDLGSDTGGSVRVPAHFCGVFAHRPTWGLVPLRGHTLTEMEADVDIGTFGPIARSANDLAIVTSLLINPDPDDSELRQTLPPPVPSLSGLRIAVWAGDTATSTEPETVTAITALAHELERAGAFVDREARPDFDAATAYQLYVRLLGAVTTGFLTESEIAQWQAQALSLAPDDNSTKALTLRTAGMTHRTWIALNEQRYKFRRTWSIFLRDFDVLLCPVFGRPALPLMDSQPRWDRVVQVGHTTVAHDELLFWSGISAGFGLPSSVAPIGRSTDGLPIGVQIVGRPFADNTTIGVAGLIEALRGGFVPPPGWE